MVVMLIVVVVMIINSGDDGDEDLFKHVTPWSLCYNLIDRALLGS
jgi:hypothetical protein